jgi:hypothetical protein
MSVGALTRFRRRSVSERKLLTHTAVLFLFAHLVVRLKELRKARSAMARIARTIGARATDPVQLSWAIASVNTNLPGRHSCLIDALCCEAIAENSGIATEFRIGAAPQPGIPHFHAWVEHAGRALTGAHDGEFIPLR